ncbi:hypothetical protein B0H14DRAFT_3651606 [Mycena olivaceomarginata]|nr:hypothetical protein B0H14DRAFT_3651606 [Mycena olivaceomarginata]
MGPITKQLHTFIWSDAPIHYKISMLSYMFSYYGIAALTVLLTLNYLLLGLALNVNGFCMHSFEIWLACMVVFPTAGNLGHTILDFFFGGMAIHLTTALLAHMSSPNMTWHTTKEVEHSNFWIEVPHIWAHFHVVFIICFGLIVVMIMLSQPITAHIVPDCAQPLAHNLLMLSPSLLCLA